MPLKLNVGLSQKIGEANYGSRGASVNVEMELDGSLITEPTKLQERIRQLFGLARTSVAEELNANHGQNKTVNGQQSNGTAATNGRDNGKTANGSTKPRAATQSQVKAIYAITKAQRIDVKQLLRERFRVSQPDDLSIKEASQLIQDLKQAQEQEGGRE
jgi:hypothetical protein